jgi:hypothetical protein
MRTTIPVLARDVQWNVRIPGGQIVNAAKDGFHPWKR